VGSDEVDLVLHGLKEASPAQHQHIWSQLCTLFRSEIEQDLRDETLSLGDDDSPERVRIIKHHKDDAKVKRLIVMNGSERRHPDLLPPVCGVLAMEP